MRRNMKHLIGYVGSSFRAKEGWLEETKRTSEKNNSVKFQKYWCIKHKNSLLNEEPAYSFRGFCIGNTVRNMPGNMSLCSPRDHKIRSLILFYLRTRVMPARSREFCSVVCLPGQRLLDPIERPKTSTKKRGSSI